MGGEKAGCGGQWGSEGQAGAMLSEDHLVRRRVQLAELPSGVTRGDPPRPCGCRGLSWDLILKGDDREDCVLQCS